jgi:hypothetical protein
MNTDVAFMCKFLLIRWNNNSQSWDWCPHIQACICMQMPSLEARSLCTEELCKALGLCFMGHFLTCLFLVQEIMVCFSFPPNLSKKGIAWEHKRVRTVECKHIWPLFLCLQPADWKQKICYFQVKLNFLDFTLQLSRLVVFVAKHLLNDYRRMVVMLSKEITQQMKNLAAWVFCLYSTGSLLPPGFFFIIHDEIIYCYEEEESFYERKASKTFSKLLNDILKHH